MRLVSRAEIASLPASQSIHPDDVMWNTGKPWYFSVGQSGLQAVNHAIGATYLADVRHILDLPCGHGRVGRYLRVGFPNAEITFCDVDPVGVDFCADTFQGKRLYSQPDLTQVDLGGEYDVIWVGSLFTHVDEDRTAAWLAHLARSLSEQGVLVATFHGAWGIEVLKRNNKELIESAMRVYRWRGYGYVPYPGTPDYGLSISKASKIIEIVEAMPNTRILSYTERGWADNHDVLAISRLDRLKPW